MLFFILDSGECLYPLDPDPPLVRFVIVPNGNCPYCFLRDVMSASSMEIAAHSEILLWMMTGGFIPWVVREEFQFLLRPVIWWGLLCEPMPM